MILEQIKLTQILNVLHQTSFRNRDKKTVNCQKPFFRITENVQVQQYRSTDVSN